jgi:hypothetical protein
VNDREYGAAVVLGTIYVAARIAEEEDDETRASKMRRVIGDQAAAYEHDRQEHGGAGPRISAEPGTEVLDAVPTAWAERDATTYLIDLLFSIPFSPNKLAFDEKMRTYALQNVAFHVGLPEDSVETLKRMQRGAVKAHRELNWKRIAILGGGGLALIAITAGAAAPFIGAAVGSAAGLSGAAALLHGMAVLGGGSLAAGGLGMAGGFWIVTGAGALLGAAGGSSAALLIELGAAGARAEIVKLQVSFAHVTLPHDSKAEAASIVGKLATERDEVRKSREEALTRNDQDAPAIEELDAIIEALVRRSSAKHAVRTRTDPAVTTGRTELPGQPDH